LVSSPWIHCGPPVRQKRRESPTGVKKICPLGFPSSN
jgi:hypothetical protein